MSTATAPSAAPPAAAAAAETDHRALVPIGANRLMTAAPRVSLAALLAEAQTYVRSGLLPKAVNTPEKAVLIMATGRELGIGGLYALRNIHVIDGKPTCAAELMMALAKRDHGEDAIHVVESDNQHCVVVVRNGSHEGRFTWTIEDAKQAGLAGKEVWAKYPRAMLRSRAVSEACRATFPGSIGGLYTPEELGADMTMAPSGEMEIIPPPPSGAGGNGNLARFYAEAADRFALTEGAIQAQLRGQDPTSYCKDHELSYSALLGKLKDDWELFQDSATRLGLSQAHWEILLGGPIAGWMERHNGTLSQAADYLEEAWGQLRPAPVWTDDAGEEGAPSADESAPTAEAASAPTATKERITAGQLEKIGAHLLRIGLSESALLLQLDVERLEDLDRQTASDLLRDLGKRPNAAPTVPEADDPDAPAF